jgi:hypothetical protein
LVAVELAAQHQHRRQHFLRIDDRQVGGDADIGSGAAWRWRPFSPS